VVSCETVIDFQNPFTGYVVDKHERHYTL